LVGDGCPGNRVAVGVLVGFFDVHVGPGVLVVVGGTGVSVANAGVLVGAGNVGGGGVDVGRTTVGVGVLVDGSGVAVGVGRTGVGVGEGIVGVIAPVSTISTIYSCPGTNPPTLTVPVTGSATFRNVESLLYIHRCASPFSRFF